jgi:hypothetical protein
MLSDEQNDIVQGEIEKALNNVDMVMGIPEDKKGFFAPDTSAWWAAGFQKGVEFALANYNLLNPKKKKEENSLPTPLFEQVSPFPLRQPEFVSFHGCVVCVKCNRHCAICFSCS